MSKINDLINQMTLLEKAALCTGATAWTTTPVQRLAIPEMMVTDGPHGVRRVPDTASLAAQSLPATCFPTASCLASTWDVDLLYTMGQALAEEAIALNVDVLLGPGVNMKRIPHCGRNFEYFSEDPFLAGELALGLVNGIQSKGIGTSLKHFAVNNQEFERFSINAILDERTLREIYLPAFETVVKKAKPWTVMCAYNKLNGVYCSEHHQLLVDILKNEWGYEGLVVSDWGAVHDRVVSLIGGVDLEMPGPQDRRVQAVVDAVKNGKLDEAVLDESVRRILGIVFKAAETPKGGSFDIAAHHDLARRVAAEGIVLLKNNGILPMKDPKHIAVIGSSAKTPHFQGGGSSHINPTQVTIPWDELYNQAVGAELTFAEGYPADESYAPVLIDEAVKNARAADIALVFIALPSYKESEGYDRTDLDLTHQQVALIKAVAQAQPNTIIILNNGSPVVMSDWIDHVAAVIEVWMMGQAGGGAIIDVLYGRVNPCGKLAETFPLKMVDTPAYLHYPGEHGEARYGEGIFIGYRYYDAKETPVLFPFGFGLSYTNYKYTSAQVSSKFIKDTDGLTVSVDLTNVGNMAGKEIVQVYVHDRKSGLIRPRKELKGFAKVELQPGETKTVSINLDFRAFAFYHPGYHQWITEDGEFDILIGASSADIRFIQTVEIQSTLELPCLLNNESTIRHWLADRRGKVVLEPIFTQMMSFWSSVFGGGEDHDAGIGMDVMGFMMDMPLLSILHFQATTLPTTAEQIVDDLLVKVHGME